MSTRLIDNAVLDVKDSVIFRLATAAELEEANFFVFRPDEGHTLFSVNGVVFTKGGTENPQEPQKFNTATAPPEAEPLLHIARISPVRRTRGGIDPPSASLGPRPDVGVDVDVGAHNVHSVDVGVHVDVPEVVGGGKVVGVRLCEDNNRYQSKRHALAPRRLKKEVLVVKSRRPTLIQ